MDSLLPLFTNNLLPVFLMMGSGFVLGKTIRIEARTLSRVVFYIFSPCLIFELLTRNQLGDSDLLRMLGFSVLHFTVLGVLAFLLARLLRLDRRLLVAVVLTVMFSNSGNFGLSVNLFAFGETALAHASVYFVVSGMVVNTVGVLIASLGRSDLKQALLGLLRIPTVYAVILALIFIRMDWALPLPLERTISVLADAAIPSMLVLLGMLLLKTEWAGQKLALSLAGGMRLLASPALALGVAAFLGLQGAARQAGILETAMPTAVMTTVLATEFEVEPAFVTTVVLATTLLSPLTLTPVLAFLGG